MITTTATTTTEEKAKTYPYLGICDSNGCIVLFTSEDTGMAVHRGTGCWPVGDYEDGLWREEDFEVFQGSLTLENN